MEVKFVSSLDESCVNEDFNDTSLEVESEPLDAVKGIFNGLAVSLFIWGGLVFLLYKYI